MQTATETNWTYEEKLANLAKAGFSTHRVIVSSDRFKVRETIKCRSEDEAREIALMLVEAARKVHGEEVIQGRYVDDYSGVAKTYTLDEVVYEMDSLVHMMGWSVEVWCDMPRKGDTEEISGKPEFVFGHRFGANRMANPKSKVFLSVGGRDCDGYQWGSVHEFKTLLEAHEYLEETQRWADGPMGWSVITRGEFEAYGY